MKRNSIFIKTVKMNKIITLLILSVLLSTILATIIATSLQSFKFYYINQWLGKFSLNGYMHAFESENRYFAHDYFLENKRDSFGSLLFSSISDIKLQDIRTLVSREIPGLSKYYFGILVAGEGTDFTNIPNESSIPMEDITKKREVDTSKLDELKKHSTTENKTSSPKGTHSVLVYHSHSWESFLPLIPGATKLNEASSPEVNVSLLGNKLRELLEAKNIPVVHDSTNMSEYLATKGLNWETAYKGSRQIVQATLAQNKDIKYLIDLHRDDARKKQTTKIINGKSYARLFFIVGMENKNKQQNMELVKKINTALEQKYTGISRGIFPKYYYNGNGVYNQDLSSNSLLIEIGGVDNTMEELNNSVEALAEIISEQYWQNEKVNG